MPGATVHDAVTLIVAVPTAWATYAITSDVRSTAIVTSAFLIGGLMFGPDLDTRSRQFSRWWFLKPLWLPYRLFFRHRSRLTHGLAAGALIRIVYFMGVVTLAAMLALMCYHSFDLGKAPSWYEITRSWSVIGAAARRSFGENVFFLGFVGLWIGAASHTLTDVVGTYISSGRRQRAL
jgi:uncharacterized metal-binding protein